MESHTRSIVKTFTWRLIATLVTMSVAWIILGRFTHAVEIGLLDTMIKLAAYYGHERAWDKVSIGRARAPEYSI